MLIADATSSHIRARIAALLTQGQRLDIHGVLLGAWPDGDTVTVADDGTTTPADSNAAHHSPHLADVGRLTTLDTGETINLITTLAESHTGRPPPGTPTEPTTAPPPAPTTEASPRPIAKTVPAASQAAAEPSADAPGTAADAAVQPVTAAHAATTPTAPMQAHTTGPADQPDPGEAAGLAQPATSTKQITVSVLGRPAIVGADPQRSLRAKSLELLVYLAVQDGAAPVENILDDLLPDAPASKAGHRLHTYVSDLRAVLRHNVGPGTYITHPNHHYALNKDTVDIDLWRMRTALRDAETADTNEERIAALRRAVDTYQGHLADGCDYEWAEPYREGIRQLALDAALALADLRADQPIEQLHVLQAALGHSPYAEPLYQTAMRAHAALGDLDAIRALRRTLTRRLAEIDAEPDTDTLALADDLVTALQRPHARPGRRGIPDSGDGAAA